MRIFAPLAVAMLVFANASATDDPVVPMVEEPRHRVLWGNSSMHILDLRIPPGDTTLFHTHNSPIFYITIQNSSIRTQQFGKEWQVRRRRNLDAGAVRLNEAYLAEPVTHRVNNIGAETIRSILILNERGAIKNRQINVRQSLPGIPEIDGTWFSQSRIILEGGQRLNWDGVDAGVAFVLVSDSHVTLDVPGTSEVYGLTSLQSVIYLHGDHGYRFENHSKESATIIAVALL